MSHPYVTPAPCANEYQISVGEEVHHVNEYQLAYLNKFLISTRCLQSHI